MRTTFGFRQLQWLTVGLAALILSGCAILKPSDIETSPNDPRAYRHLVLDNQLQVLLISDPATEKAAAALDVSVGSRHDPREHQGLAHFLEHMLFLGTEKYPEPGEYQSFISRHGGSHNAYTAYENTNYFFEIQPDFLEPALDRFSQQFVAPLFTADYVQREKNAVHSEFTSGLRDDGRRFYSALKEVINPQHPFSNFSVGNLDTLADREGRSIRDAMLEFYERHYSANQMRLVIYGKEDLDTLEQWARQKFSAIPNRNVANQPVKVPLITPGTLPALLTVEPIMEQRTLSLIFPMPSIKPHYRAKPEYYLTNLIGHEGEGSLLSWLKKQGWANSLVAGMALDNQEESALSINLSLTQEGLKHYPQVIRATFQYIGLIRQQGIDRWRFDEQAKLLDVDFRFQEKAAPIHYTSYLASRMRHYSAKEVLVAPYLMDRYDPKLYQELLTYLTPDNVLISLMAKGVDTDRETAWYQAPYSYRPLTEAERQNITPTALAGAMHMPEPNPFVPNNLDMRPQPDMPEPARLPSKANLQAWYMQDTSFGTPRGNFYLSVRSPLANTSPRNAVLTELFVQLADDQLNEYVYPAALAGLNYRIYKHLRGFTIRLEGYSDKQQIFLNDILDRLTALEPTPERFEIAYDNLRRKLENAQQYRPYERTLSEVRKLLLEPYWTEQELLQALQSVRYEDLAAFIPDLLGEMTTVTLAHGNFSQEQALEMTRLVAEKLADKAKFVPVERSQVVSLQRGSNWIQGLALEHRDTGFTWLFQAPDREYRTRAQYSLLAQLFSAPYYHELRTERQLGYVVFSTPMTLLEVPALAFVVQSPGATPEQLKEATWSFLQQAAEQLKVLPDEVYEQHRQSLMANLLQQPTTLTEKSERFWLNIDEKNYRFDTLERIAMEVATLDKAELIELYENQILANPTSLLAFSQFRDADKAEAAWSPEGFRKVESKKQLIEVNGLFPNR